MKDYDVLHELQYRPNQNNRLHFFFTNINLKIIIQLLLLLLLLLL